MICIKILDAGSSFGELALLDDSPRLASIKCHSDSHFAILMKEDFQNILAAHEKQNLLREMGFFSKLEFLTNLEFL